MPTKLKNLKIKKVDFVDDGANPEAHIKLFKRNDSDDGYIQRLVDKIVKALKKENLSDDEITKSNTTDFQDSFENNLKRINNRKIYDEIYNICNALQDSFFSIINDNELDIENTKKAMIESFEQFANVTNNAIEQWSSGKSAELEEQAELATVEKNTVASDISIKEKEGETTMIDKSKLTEAERAFLESIEKRYGIETQRKTTAEGTTEVEKSAPKEQIETQDKDTDNIYKGLNPTIKAELESLKKFKENAENKELEAIAKKYEIIGEKKDKLVPLFKSLKLAGGTAYDDTITMLDNAVTAIEKSGIFKEIGKTGSNTGSAGANGEAWAKAEAQAMDIMKAKNITKAQALDEVFINNPELAVECEKEE